jgi:hypothetical protein
MITPVKSVCNLRIAGLAGYGKVGVLQGIGVYFQSSKGYWTLGIITTEDTEFHGGLAINQVSPVLLRETPRTLWLNFFKIPLF